MEKVQQTFVINLQRRPERLEEFFTRYPYQQNTAAIFSAIDGYNLDKYQDDATIQELVSQYHELRKQNPRLPPLRKGEFGCLASHIKIYQHMIENHIQNAAIFEDDAFFHIFFKKTWYQLSESLDFETIKRPSSPTGPGGFLYLGGRFVDNFMTQPYRPSSFDSRLVYHDFQHWNGRNHDRTTHAYIIRLDVAQMLFDYFVQGKGLGAPIDHSILNFFREHDTPPLNTQPLLCHSPMNYDSDIQGKNDFM